MRRSVAKLFLSENSNCSRELRVGVHRYAPASVNAAELFRWRPDARRCDRGTGSTADVLTASRRPDGWLIVDCDRGQRRLTSMRKRLRVPLQTGRPCKKISAWDGPLNPWFKGDVVS